MPKVLEPATFWTGIANDNKQEKWRRALAVYLLVERHVKPDITLGQLATMLDHPNWIEAQEVSKVVALAGNLPGKITDGDSIFVIRVFEDKSGRKGQISKERFAIYIKVTGEIDKKDLVPAIMNTDKTAHDGAKIKEFALSPKWDDYLKQIKAP
jgi:hypothetical protein